MKKLTIITIILGIGITVVPALPQERFQAGGYFNLGMPQGEFNDVVDRVGYGGHFYFLVRIDHRSPLLIGGAFDFLIYGYDRYETPLSYTLPNIYVDVTTTNAMLSGFFQARLQPVRGHFRPYIDAYFGFNHFTTDINIGDNGYDDWGDSFAGENLLRDTALSYGAGVGFMFPLYIRRTGRAGGGVGIYMDLGIRYLVGGTADYMTEYSVLYDEYYRTRTDLVSAIIGISVGF